MKWRVMIHTVSLLLWLTEQQTSVSFMQTIMWSFWKYRTKTVQNSDRRRQEEIHLCAAAKRHTAWQSFQLWCFLICPSVTTDYSQIQLTAHQVEHFPCFPTDTEAENWHSECQWKYLKIKCRSGQNLHKDWKRSSQWVAGSRKKVLQSQPNSNEAEETRSGWSSNSAVDGENVLVLTVSADAEAHLMLLPLFFFFFLLSVKLTVKSSWMAHL